MSPVEESTSIGFRSFLMVVAVVSLVAQVYAETAEDRQAGATLTAGEIDSSTVEVGAFAVVIHGLGERHPVSGAWEQLKTDRGYIVAIDAETLTLGLDQDAWPKVIALARIQTLVLVGSTSIGGVVERAGRGTRGELANKAQSLSPRAPDKDSTEVDSSRAVNRLRETPYGRSMGRVKERHRSLGIQNVGLRLLAKVAVGTVSGAWFTGASAGVAGKFDPPREDGENTHRGLGLLLFGASIGSSVGFPLGVSVVDPHDSLPKTLFAGVIPGVAGYSLLWVSQDNDIIAFPLTYFGPVISSLIASEVWRKPPQDRRFSFGLAPNPDSGLSAVAQLRF